mmetsp:Transcript_86271/g.200588  ORF Transcript_86271/g.200588 Transcript_86271/m.200588 type:complete len:276 (-) Transcript_86271:219-1046(-)
MPEAFLVPWRVLGVARHAPRSLPSAGGNGYLLCHRHSGLRIPLLEHITPLPHELCVVLGCQLHCELLCGGLRERVPVVHPHLSCHAHVNTVDLHGQPSVEGCLCAGSHAPGPLLEGVLRFRCDGELRHPLALYRAVSALKTGGVCRVRVGHDQRRCWVRRAMHTPVRTINGPAALDASGEQEAGRVLPIGLGLNDKVHARSLFDARFLAQLDIPANSAIREFRAHRAEVLGAVARGHVPARDSSASEQVRVEGVVLDDASHRRPMGFARGKHMQH